MPDWTDLLRPVASHARTNQGLIRPGNVDLVRRPRVTNPDGSVSTVRSMSFQQTTGGPETLVPTTFPGGNLPDEQAILHYVLTGQHLGQFDTPANATRYAKQLHDEYARGWYDRTGK